MVKKVVLWTFYAAFVGLLVLGAINRTSAASNSRSEISGQSLNPSEYVEMDKSEASSEVDNQEVGEAETYSDELDTEDHEAHVREIITLNGTVSSITTRVMSATIADGQRIELAGRQWRFSLDQGFDPQIEDAVTLDAFYNEKGILEIIRIANLDNGQVVILRDEEGHPLWVNNATGE